MFLLKNQILHEKIEILKNGQKGSLGICIAKLYKKFHQAAMIGGALNRNQIILKCFSWKINFFMKKLKFWKTRKNVPGDWYTKAVQKISPGYDV